MARITFDNEFKEAVCSLPEKEKDKLLLRLLKKDASLVKQLYFQLIDDKDIDQRRADLEVIVHRKVADATNRFYSPGYLLLDMRFLSSEITAHVKTTKDKFGEISLNLQMLVSVLEGNNKKIEAVPYGKAYTCCMYVIARTFRILLLLKRIHQDYYVELEADFIKLGNLIGENSHLMKTAINNGLDVNWLTQFNVPENIAAIHKELKANGFLK